MFVPNCTEDQLRNLPEKPIKVKSQVHEFVPHWELVKQIRKLSDPAQEMGNFVIGLSYTKLDMVAAVEVFDKSAELGPNSKLWLGVVNSNSKKRASRFFGCVTIDDLPIVMNRYPVWRHKTGLDIKERTKYALDLLALQGPEYPVRFAEMRRRKLSPEETDFILFKAVKESAIGSSKLAEISVAKKRLERDREATALTLCLAVGSALMKGEPITDNPCRDHLNRLYSFRRLAMTNTILL